MKKSKILIFICVLMFMFVGVVEARKNPFVIDWNDNNKNITYGLAGMVDTNLVYGDGYVTFHVNMNSYDGTTETVMRKYDHNGNLEKEEVLDNQIVINAVTDGEYIYALQADLRLQKSVQAFNLTDSDYYDEEVGLYIVKYNSNLKETSDYVFKESDFENYPGYYYGYGNVLYSMIVRIQFLGKILGYNTMTVVDDTIYILSYGYSTFEIDTNLNDFLLFAPSKNPESSKVKKYFEQFYYTSKLSDDMFNGIISLDSNDQNIAYTSLSCVPDIASIVADYRVYNLDETFYPSDGEKTCDLAGNIGLTDADGNKLWEKDLEYDLLAINVKLIGDYVVAIGLSEDGTEILVYDLAGNLVQNITNKVVGFSNLVPTKNGFIVSKNVTDFDDCYEVTVDDLYGGISDESRYELDEIYMTAEECYNCALDTTTEVYQLPYNISVLTTGEGEVDVVEDAYVGEEVEIKVSPKFGWLVEQILVIDENGNEIEVKNNKFYMPDSNVTIDVTFKNVVENVIENPNTAAISITGLGLIVIVLGVITYRNYKKIKFLK